MGIPTGTVGILPGSGGDPARETRIQESEALLASMASAVEAKTEGQYVVVAKPGFGLSALIGGSGFDAISDDQFNRIYPLDPSAYDVLPITATAANPAGVNTSRAILPYSDYVADQGWIGTLANVTTGAVIGGGVLDAYGAFSLSTPQGVYGPELPSGAHYTGQETVATGFSTGPSGVGMPSLDFNFSTASGAFALFRPLLGDNDVTRWLDKTLGNVFNVASGKPLQLNDPPSTPSPIARPQMGFSFGGGGGGGTAAASRSSAAAIPTAAVMVGLFALGLLAFLLFARR